MGSKLRVDCTLGDISQGSKRNPDGTMNKNSESAANSVGATISPFSWERGDLSFIFDIEKIGAKDSIIFMDNARKTYTIIDKNAQIEFEHDLDKETDLMLSKEMVFLKSLAIVLLLQISITTAAKSSPCLNHFGDESQIEQEIQEKVSIVF